MQHDLELIRAAKATERREMAIAAYDLACDVPENADWQLVAEMLRICIPNARKAKAAPAAGDPPPDDSSGGQGFAPWHSAPVRYTAALRNVETARYETTFADGRVIRSSGWKIKGKWNAGQAVGAAVELYRYKVRPGAFYVADIDVPEIVSVVNTETGDEYDPAIASAETAGKRVGEIRAIKTPPAKQRERVMRRLGWFEDPGFGAMWRRGKMEDDCTAVWPPVEARMEVDRALAWFETAGQTDDAEAREARRKDAKAAWPPVRTPRAVKVAEIEPTPTPAPSPVMPRAFRVPPRLLSSTAIRMAA